MKKYYLLLIDFLRKKYINIKKTTKKDIIKFILLSILINFISIGIFFYVYIKLEVLDKIVVNNKEISIEDKENFDNELNANGKDIIVIVDMFERKGYHGEEVSDRLLIYFKHYLKKDLDIKIIKLSLNKELGNIENLNLIDYKEKRFYRYKSISNNSYSLETYLKKIKELNPNSKIAFSQSTFHYGYQDKLIELSNKYNFKIGLSYFNEFNRYNIFLDIYSILWFYLMLDKTTNTNVIALERFKPLFIKNYLTINNLKKEYQTYSLKHYSTSFLTPIITYELYLNSNSNIIQK